MPSYRYCFSTRYNLRVRLDKRWELVSVLQRVPGIAPLVDEQSARPVVVRVRGQWLRGWVATRKVHTAMGPRWQLHVLRRLRAHGDVVARFSARKLREWVRKGFMQPCYDLRMPLPGAQLAAAAQGPA
jgi:hypothetical protein